MQEHHTGELRLTEAVPSPSLDGAVMAALEGAQFEVTFPDESGLSQDKEWCVVKTPDGAERTIRFHDYDQIYEQPGLYEKIFYERLGCTSPSVITEELAKHLSEQNVSPDVMRILDLGAGNGLVSRELKDQLSISQFLGVDIIPEAARAADRDQPGLYADYVVADLTSQEGSKKLAVAAEDLQPNCLICVAALGFGDIPARAFSNAFNVLPENSWIAFNLKSDFYDAETDKHGFSKLIDQIQKDGTIELLSTRRYPHRKDINGNWLDYVAIVARKHNDIDPGLVEGIEQEGEAS